MLMGWSSLLFPSIVLTRFVDRLFWNTTIPYASVLSGLPALRSGPDIRPCGVASRPPTLAAVRKMSCSIDRAISIRFGFFLPRVDRLEA